jgi:hypothetical protein
LTVAVGVDVGEVTDEVPWTLGDVVARWGAHARRATVAHALASAALGAVAAHVRTHPVGVAHAALGQAATLGAASVERRTAHTHDVVFGTGEGSRVVATAKIEAAAHLARGAAVHVATTLRADAFAGAAFETESRLAREGVGAG